MDSFTLLEKVVVLSWSCRFNVNERKEDEGAEEEEAVRGDGRAVRFNW